MFQWHEHKQTKTKTQTGGSKKTTTTYTYKEEWSDRVIDSTTFEKPDGHQNPGSMPFSSQSLTAKVVTLGAFKLSSSQIGQMGAWSNVPLTAGMLQQIPEPTRQRVQIRDGAFYVPARSGAQTPAPAAQPATDGAAADAAEPAESAAEAARTPVASATGDSEEGGDEEDAESENATPAPVESTPSDAASGSSAEPQVGDVRITFRVVRPATISVIAQQTGDSFRPYQTEAGDKLDMLEMGNRSADDMFQAAVAANTRMTWILRAVGFVMMMLGVGMVFGPLAVVADFIPFLGDLLRAGVFVVALAIALPLSLATIAVAWLAYRPVLGISLIVIGVAAGVGVFMLFRKKKSAAPKG
jgi:hypothetical protein